MSIISKIMPNITHLFGILLNFVPTLSLQVENSHKPCGWGHHKRRKKNARGRFDRRKNDERRRQQANKENISVLPPPKSTDIIPDSSLLLPKHWQKLSNTQYCKLEEGSNGLGEVTASVILDSYRTLNAYVGAKKVPYTCDVLARFQSSSLTDDKLSKLWQCSFMPRQSRWEICLSMQG